jgi:hypothetical protein
MAENGLYGSLGIPEMCLQEISRAVMVQEGPVFAATTFSNISRFTSNFRTFSSQNFPPSQRYILPTPREQIAQSPFRKYLNSARPVALLALTNSDLYLHCTA